MSNAPDPNNPTIMCDERQLAWRAWQDAANVPTAEQHDQTNLEFDGWWQSVEAAIAAAIEAKRPNPITSLRVLCNNAWCAARLQSGFGDWWGAVVAAQPVTTDPAPTSAPAP